MSTDIKQVQTELAELKQEIMVLRAQSGNERRRLRVLGAAAIAAIAGAMLISPTNRAAIAQTSSDLAARVAVLEHKTQYMTSDTATMSTRFSGCNLHVDNGAGRTDSPAVNSDGDGLGNLIIGYNLRTRQNIPARSGSHNLIIGDNNSYSSYGGIVSGYANGIGAPYATVTGGYFNSAYGEYSSVSGGGGNISWASASSISGGEGNYAYGANSSVSGGAGGSASGNSSSVSGGYINSSSTDYSWSGGYYSSPD